MNGNFALRETRPMFIGREEYAAIQSLSAALGKVK